MGKFVIPGNPIPKKNNMQIWKNAGRITVAPSKRYLEYAEVAQWYVPKLGIDYPVNIKCTFYRADKRRIDLVNLLESVDDILQAGGAIKDDCCTIVAGHDGSRVFYDKENPRVEVEITRLWEDQNE